MKRLIILIGAACAALTVTINAQKLTTQSDSLAYFLGRSEGARMSDNINNLPDTSNLKVDRKAFIQGMEKAVEMSQKDGVGYADGFMMAMQYIGRFRQMEKDGIDVNIPLFFKELKEQYLAKSVDKDAMESNTATAMSLLRSIEEKKQQERNAQTEREYNANMVQGQAFIDSLAASDPTLVRMPDGLVYKVTTLGNGPKVGDAQDVEVIYTGRFTDGSVFDSSNGQAISFNVDRVIPGFSEGLQQLPEGSKATLYIPGNLAYGRQAPPQIGPGRTLVFDVEVVKVNK